MEAVHAARKQIKQLRALLRLAGTSVHPRANRKLMRGLKCAATTLAPPRDAFVKASALKSLKQHFKQELDGQDFPMIENRLMEDRTMQQRCAAKRMRKTRGAFKRTCRQFRDLELESGGWHLIGPGLKRTYRDGRRAYRVARDRERPEDFHEWRKRVKDLYYHVEFLCSIWPEQMHAMQQELDQLGECLGNDHDLMLVTDRDMLCHLPAEAKAEAETLVKLARRRESELRMHALAVGDRLYSEKPSIFCKRLKKYWKRWRHREKTPA
jgi:CHAD domain-containing protein